jgi:tRNA(adenine34) deaminase
MGLALEEARKALALDEVPVGAIVIQGTEVVGRGFNQRERLKSPIAHAEILAINQAAETLGTWRLNDTVLYATMEPCAMCAGALVLARIQKVIFAVRDAKGGACGTVFNVVNDRRINHRVEIVEGIRAEESREIIQSFFREKRRQKKLNPSQ